MSQAPTDYLEYVREVAEGFDVFGELGRKSEDDIWFLAREQGAVTLVALRLQRARVDDKGKPVFSLEVARELGAEVSMGEGDCIMCRAKLRSFARFCSKCGADQTHGTRVAGSDAERLAQLSEVRAAAADLYEVLGEMPWAAGAGTVYFAVERNSGVLVRLRLRQAQGGFELGETQVAMTLSGSVTAAYMTEVAPAKAPPIVRLRPSGPGPAPAAAQVPPPEPPPAAPRVSLRTPEPPASTRERTLRYAVIALSILVLALLLLLIFRA